MASLELSFSQQCSVSTSWTLQGCRMPAVGSVLSSLAPTGRASPSLAGPAPRRRRLRGGRWSRRRSRRAWPPRWSWRAPSRARRRRRGWRGRGRRGVRGEALRSGGFLAHCRDDGEGTAVRILGAAGILERETLRPDLVHDHVVPTRTIVRRSEAHPRVEEPHADGSGRRLRQ
jgi:hypothetical protein